MKLRRIVSAAGAWACLAAHAAPGPMRCDPAPSWESFSSIATTVRSSGPDPIAPEPLSFAMTVHDDGIRIVSDGVVGKGPSHLELVRLDRPEGRVLLGSDPSTPTQLGEVDMVFALPLAALKHQAESPCGLREATRHSVDFRIDDLVVKGELQREGDTIRFTLEEQRGPQHEAFAGRVAYARDRGALPADLALRGWTIFRNGGQPEDGEPSRFDTLAALRESLAASGAKYVRAVSLR